MSAPRLIDVYPEHQGSNIEYVKHWKTLCKGIHCVALEGAEHNHGVVYIIKCKDGDEVQRVLDGIDQRLKVFYG